MMKSRFTIFYPQILEKRLKNRLWALAHPKLKMEFLRHSDWLFLKGGSCQYEAFERLPGNIQQALLIVTAVIKRIQKKQESEKEDIQSR